MVFYLFVIDYDLELSQMIYQTAFGCTAVNGPADQGQPKPDIGAQVDSSPGTIGLTTDDDADSSNS